MARYQWSITKLRTSLGTSNTSYHDCLDLKHLDKLEAPAFLHAGLKAVLALLSDCEVVTRFV